MSEYTELTAKIEALEKRVKYLEDTFATLADMNKSGEMGQYIAQRQRALAASKLVNAAVGTQKLNADAQQQVIDQLAAEKAAMDARIEEAIRASAQNAPDENDLAEQFTYRDVPGGVEILGFNGFEVGEELILPNKIKRKSVVGIGKEAFKNMSFKKVTIPDGVKYIGYNAFSGCTFLKQLDLPDSLETINTGCFDNTGLTDVVIPENVKSLCYRCFGNCNKLKNVILNENLEIVGEQAFYGTNISKIVVPQSVQEIHAHAFETFGSGRIDIAVLGLKTKMDMMTFRRTEMVIYCLAGSEAQQEARRKNILVKPLGEFKNV